MASPEYDYLFKLLLIGARPSLDAPADSHPQPSRQAPSRLSRLSCSRPLSSSLAVVLVEINLVTLVAWSDSIASLVLFDTLSCMAIDTLMQYAAIL